MDEEKRQINWDALWLLIGSIIVAILITVAGVMTGHRIIYGYGPNIIDQSSRVQVSFYSIIAIVIAWVMACSSIAGLFRNTRSQRDGLFSAVFILHVIAFVIGYFGAADSAGGFTNLILLIVALIISIVCDSCYEGIGNTKDNRGENPIEAHQKELAEY